MATITAERAQAGYALAADEGEAFWLLGMLQTIKIGRDEVLVDVHLALQCSKCYA